MKAQSSKRIGSYPALGVTLSISLALYAIGIFGILIIYADGLEKLVRENVMMQIYLNSSVNETQQQQLENKLKNLPFTDKSKANSIQFVSKEEAAKKFIAETGEDFQSFLGDNPLKDAFLIRVAPEYQNSQSLLSIKKQLESINGVFQAFYVEGLIDNINNNVNKIGLFLIFIISLLLITIIVLINNTIRIALFSQRFLIRSMQLVGAKQSFIQWPFLKRALLYGFIASIVATLGLYGSIWYAQQQIVELVVLFNIQQFFILSGVLAIIGLLISLISSYFATRKYLRLSLDELF
ncbi:MAG: permease-like cell division protein FtsX [Cyclobacteriaceae bacterium]|jgi:cell division transport system permease protein|nr:permease-like cell division protein FtsX [Cyclobacteriaceae bacterium]